ncbi:uncharacterized protein LOC121390431 [Gigantopelta aegis]|uniref:uncharacterized protein LOC121390431 n=1 Tax=Gigantopelta aegis TaxID=1735272 RepID=UPI001B889B1C|nr:uncharacterized protein LOC121390431 [Gigantopelta aegis]
MWMKIVWAAALCCFMGVIIAQQQTSKCEQQFQSNLYTCLQNQSLDVKNFLWFVTNKTGGQAPADQASFKTQVCGKQRSVFQCGIGFMRALMAPNSPCAKMTPPTQPGQAAPAPVDMRKAVESQFWSFFGTLDSACAHPCRRTLANDLKGCYDAAGLDSALFLSNTSMSRGAVIGTQPDQVKLFCENNAKLVTCMKQKRSDCPEAPLVLRAIGLDIESMDKGVKVLCKHQKDYLKGIPCFAEPTDKVVSCQEDQGKKMMQLMMATQQGLNESTYFVEFCRIRLDHVKCDLGAWAQKKHEACNQGVIGLRTELECTLLPDQCSTAQKEKIADVCHVDKFFKHLRAGAGGGGGASATSVTFALFGVTILALTLIV